MLGVHVEAIDPNDLWNSIQTRNKVHKHNIPVHGHGPSNSTTIDSNTPLMTTSTSPIMEHHVEMSQSEGSSMVTVNKLFEDPQIWPNMIQSALNAITSLSTPRKTTHSAESDDPEVPHQVSVASTPTSNDSPDINKELNTYKDRFALELTNFKKQLETQSKIEVKCTKQNLKSEFEYELRHQTLLQTKTINLLRQQVDQLDIQLQQWQAALQLTYPVLIQTPPLPDATLPPPTTLTSLWSECLSDKQ